jgi:hypothetical protein
MGALQYMRLDEKAEAASSIVAEPLLGAWLNTNAATGGIVKTVLAAKENGIVLRIFAADGEQVVDWGETAAGIFAADATATEAMAFSAFYDFGFMETQLQGHVRQGVLILAKFDRFKDDSGRSNYLSKEFFYRTDT